MTPPARSAGSASVNEEACERLGLDATAVRRLANRLARAAADASRMGLGIFGGSGTGSLRKHGGGAQNDVAHLGSNFDGGDGGDEY